jgi:hypothetical protein
MCLANSSGTSLATRFATIQLPGVRIMYDGLATISGKFSLFAHAELMKSCKALESNRMMIGCPDSKKVPTSTSSPSIISLTMVWLTWLLLSIRSLN